MSEGFIALVGVMIAALACVVAVLAWLRPKNPRGRLDRYTTRIESVQEGYDFYKFLLKHDGKRVWIDITISPVVVNQSRTEGDDHYFFYIERGDARLRDEGDDVTAGIQFNLFGLMPKDIENTFGWGGPRGYLLHGTYIVVDSGIGTGGIMWVALQARKQSD